MCNIYTFCKRIEEHVQWLTYVCIRKLYQHSHYSFTVLRINLYQQRRFDTIELSPCTSDLYLNGLPIFTDLTAYIYNMYRKAKHILYYITTKTLFLFWFSIVLLVYLLLPCRGTISICVLLYLLLPYGGTISTKRVSLLFYYIFYFPMEEPLQQKECLCCFIISSTSQWRNHFNHIHR